MIRPSDQTAATLRCLNDRVIAVDEMNQGPNMVARWRYAAALTLGVASLPRAGNAEAETMASLQRSPRDTLKQRFILRTIQPAIMGGKMLGFSFEHDSGAYAAWMYQLGGTTWVVRAWGSTKCTPAQQHWIAVTYGAVYDSLGFATPPP